MNQAIPCSPRLLFALVFSAHLLVGCTAPSTGSRNDGAALAHLMVERLNWMDEVAAFKQARSLPVSDPAREAELMKAMEQKGSKAGLPATPTRAFFTGQTTAAKEFQMEWLQQHPHPTQQKVPDLTKTVRPALDRISADMISHLARLRASGSDAASTVGLARQKLVRAGFSERVIAPALEGLEAALRN